MKNVSFLKYLAIAFVITAGFSSCLKKHDDYVVAAAQVMIVHASPDTPPIDLYLDGRLLNNIPFSYPNTTGYFLAYAGQRYFQIAVSGAQTSLFDATLPLNDAKSYTVFTYDRADSIKPLFVNDDLAAPSSGKSNIRFFHLSPGTGTVTFGYIDTSNTFQALFSNRNFETQQTTGTSEAFTSVAAGDYHFQIRSGTGSVVVDLPVKTLQNGKIYTVFAKGIDGSSNSPLGAEIISNN